MTLVRKDQNRVMALGSFSGHCENSRRIIDSSVLQSEDDVAGTAAEYHDHGRDDADGEDGGDGDGHQHRQDGKDGDQQRQDRRGGARPVMAALGRDQSNTR